MERLLGKRIVITGSSRSLGRQFAIACGREGASLILNGTNPEALAASVAEVRETGAEVHPVLGSVADETTCIDLVRACVEKFGGIDVMVNNAGIVRDRTLLKMSAEEFDDVVAVDLRGPFLCTREAGRAMAAQETGGHVIQITSASGLVGNFGQTNYAAAKAGMMGITYTAVKELASKNIRCNAMWPVARTEMTQPIIDRIGKSAEELGFGESEDVALALVWLASDAAAHWNGQCLTMNGRRIALWNSPQEQDIRESGAPFSMEELESHLSSMSPLPIYERTRG